MSTINFDQFFQSLKDGIGSLAKQTVQDYLDQAKSDGEAALDSMKENLQHWTSELTNGSITADDLSFLLKEEAALDEMTALKEAGLAEVRIDQFRDGIVSLVVGAVTGLVKV
jgi:hypothetical protein